MLNLDEIFETIHTLQRGRGNTFDVYTTDTTARFMQRATIVVRLGWSRKRLRKWFRRWKVSLRKERARPSPFLGIYSQLNQPPTP